MNSEVVQDARAWANWLVMHESKGPGDTENAMRRLENRYGVPFRAFWTLRYRHGVKDVFASVYLGLRAAYEAEHNRQMKLLEHEITIAKAKGVFVDDLADKVPGLGAQHVAQASGGASQ